MNNKEHDLTQGGANVPGAGRAWEEQPFQHTTTSLTCNNQEVGKVTAACSNGAHTHMHTQLKAKAQQQVLPVWDVLGSKGCAIPLPASLWGFFTGYLGPHHLMLCDCNNQATASPPTPNP